MRHKRKFVKACISTALVMGIVVSTIGSRGFVKAYELVAPSPSPTPEASAEPTATATATVQPSASSTVQPTSSTTPVPSATTQPTPTVQPVVTAPPPTKVERLGMTGSILGIALTHVHCSGYEIKICKKNGQIIKSGDVQLTTLYSTARFDNMPRNTVFYVQARTYASNGNEKIYSGWSDKTYGIPQPKLNKSGSKIYKNRIKIKWGKIAGATKYMIDMRRNGSSEWHREVAVVKKGKNSCIIRKINGKKINFRKTDYELRLRSMAEFGNRKIMSAVSETVYTKTYYR